MPAWKKGMGTSLLFGAMVLSVAMLDGCEKDAAGSEKLAGQALRSSHGYDEINGRIAADPVLSKRSANSLQATAHEVDGREVVTNPDAITVVVNKQRSLPEGYEPSDLIVPDVKFSFDGQYEKRYMRKEAAKALEKLFAGAEAEGMELRAVSGYRSYQRQKAIYNNNVRTRGEHYASRVNAVPGTSEHQTGLTMDVSSPNVGNKLETKFGESPEGKWLLKHASEYGFVIRYPAGMEGITGYVYEPWHIRYIGTDLAPDMAKSGLTLEQYFDEANIKL